MSVGGDDVDAQWADETEQLGLLCEPANHEAQVRGIRRKLSEGWVNGDPIPEVDFRPGVVVKLATHIREAGDGARRQPDGTREGDVKLRVLVAITGPRAQHLRRAWNREADALFEGVVHPSGKALCDHPRIAG